MSGISPKLNELCGSGARVPDVLSQKPKIELLKNETLFQQSEPESFKLKAALTDQVDIDAGGNSGLLFHKRSIEASRILSREYN